jgi:hypothetical protein
LANLGFLILFFVAGMKISSLCRALCGASDYGWRVKFQSAPGIAAG